MSELEEYKQTWKYEHENWTCAIYEVLLNDSTNYMVTFEDKLFHNFTPSQRIVDPFFCGGTLQ